MKVYNVFIMNTELNPCIINQHFNDEQFSWIKYIFILSKQFTFNLSEALHCSLLTAVIAFYLLAPNPTDGRPSCHAF